jgi:hypothetical protein
MALAVALPARDSDDAEQDVRDAATDSEIGTASRTRTRLGRSSA